FVRRFRDNCFDGWRGIRRVFTSAPVASGPDRIRDIPALELDPDARAHFRKEDEPDILPGVRHAGDAPSRLHILEHCGYLRFDAKGRGVDSGHRAAILAVEAVAQPLDDVQKRLLVHPVHSTPPSEAPPAGGLPTALRTRTNRIRCDSAVRV